MQNKNRLIMLQIINFCKFNFTRSLRMSLKIKPQSTHLSILSLSPHASTPPHQRIKWSRTVPSAHCRLLGVLSLKSLRVCGRSCV